ncbi:MAG: tRNA (adenosine(37)-N6)-dimethylallyltransferase MiaA, partial [Saprospiraceae bacterium]
GPTAVGKTEMSLRLAHQLSIPIISADSRQVFCEVNIGTAKPSIEQLNEVRHYFINHIPVDSSYNVGQYQHEVSDIIAQLFRVYDHILICGGTGLYIHAIRNGLDIFPEIPIEIRDQVRMNYELLGLEYLINEINRLDVEYSKYVDQSNPNRLMRALEVCLSTGLPYSSFIGKKKQDSPYEFKEIFLNTDRKSLYQRINNRVDNMIKEGLINEVESLSKYRNTQALNTVGYRELFKYIDKEWTLEMAIDKIKQHSRNYAKRQITWFNKYSQGINVSPSQDKEIMDYINA